MVLKQKRLLNMKYLLFPKLHAKQISVYSENMGETTPVHLWLSIRNYSSNLGLLCKVGCFFSPKLCVVVSRTKT